MLLFLSFVTSLYISCFLELAKAPHSKNRQTRLQDAWMTRQIRKQSPKHALQLLRRNKCMDTQLKPFSPQRIYIEYKNKYHTTSRYCCIVFWKIKLDSRSPVTNLYAWNDIYKHPYSSFKEKTYSTKTTKLSRMIEPKILLFTILYVQRKSACQLGTVRLWLSPSLDKHLPPSHPIDFKIWLVWLHLEQNHFFDCDIYL